MFSLEHSQESHFNIHSWVVYLFLHNSNDLIFKRGCIIYNIKIYDSEFWTKDLWYNNLIKMELQNDFYHF